MAEVPTDAKERAYLCKRMLQTLTDCDAWRLKAVDTTFYATVRVESLLPILLAQVKEIQDEERK